MCNEIRRAIALGQIRDDFSQIRIPLVFPEGAPNMAPLESVRITDPTVILRWHGSFEEAGAAALVTRRWSWPGPGGKPVYNYRSDGRSFANSATSGRCLIPADGFFEFTAPADPKAKRKDRWLFTKAGESWFAIAGLWRTDAKVGEAFTMLTAPPGPDIAPYHDRQIVIVERRDWAGWLDGSTPTEAVCQPLPGGSLDVVQVR